MVIRTECPCCFAKVEGVAKPFIRRRIDDPGVDGMVFISELHGVMCRCGYRVSTRWIEVKDILNR